MAPSVDQTSGTGIFKPASPKATAILHRVPWKLPIATGAEGIYIDLQDGRRLVDAVGGAAVSSIGAGNLAVAQAIKDQLEKVSYVYSMQLSNEPAEELAQWLVNTGNGAFTSCAFLAGGTEAVESAMKLAVQYWFERKQTQRRNFVARKLSYHGNSVSTLAMAYHPARRAPYAAILDSSSFHHVSPAYAKRFQKSDETEAQYVERLRQELEDKFLELGPDTVIGFVAETVVGATTGAVPAPKGYFKAMKSVCDKYGVLFILDEVMSGMGRMGTMHAWESFGDGVAPDIQSVAKGLGGGYASIGAILMSQKVTDVIRDNGGFWKHGHTYQSHPLACAASLAVQKVIEENDLLTNCRAQGEHLSTLLRDRLQSPNAIAAPFTFDVRGGGLFWGIEFDFMGPEAARIDFKGKQFSLLLQDRCFQNGLVILGLTGGANLEGNQGDHVILSPAYTVTKEEVEKIVDLFVKSVEETLQEYTV